MAKIQRLMDPIHGLIRFDDSDADQHAFELLNCPEFQRLRRIRQLGFSEFVYPGATHTRFAHSVGVYHNSRRLLNIIKAKSADYNPDRALIAMCAALLHDLGHGPFSHTFENAEKALGRTKRHEQWTSEIITSGTLVTEKLAEISADAPAEVAKIVSSTEGSDIYASVVSSQFDADRLDYLKRDRYMTGIGSGDFDMEWMLDSLEVGTVTIGQKDDFVDVPSFFLNSKGYKTAEAYLQARYQLYSMVYMHKTTRAAEKMLEALLSRFSNLLRDVGHQGLEINEQNPLVQYLTSDEPTIEQYLTLDDNVIWATLYQLNECTDEPLRNLASRLLQRQLYKCFDAGSREPPPRLASKRAFCYPYHPGSTDDTAVWIWTIKRPQ